MTIKNYKIDFGVKKGMNRAQRRRYDKQVKNDKLASICPECGAKSRFYTSEFHTSIEEKAVTVLKCERCGAIVREGEELTRSMPAGIYLSIPLDVLDQYLLEEAARIKEEPNESVNTADVVETEGEIA